MMKWNYYLLENAIHDQNILFFWCVIFKGFVVQMMPRDAC